MVWSANNIPGFGVQKISPGFEADQRSRSVKQTNEVGMVFKAAFEFDDHRVLELLIKQVFKNLQFSICSPTFAKMYISNHKHALVS